MLDKPFFSIIIPTFNRAHTIRKPINSVIAQTYIDWELIIVDDGSTDNTKEIVDSYQDPRIRYVWQENQERSEARNHGISLAQGDWMCFQDSDDEYLPEHLEVLYEGICEYPEYKMFRTGMLIYVGGKLLKKSEFDIENGYTLYPYDAFQTFGIERKVLNEIKFEKAFFNSEDLHLLIRLNALYPLKVIEKYTNIYNYEYTNSSGIGKDYYKIHSNKILVFNSLLKSPGNIKPKYLKRKLCLSHLLILSGHIKYDRGLALGALNDLGLLFAKYPLSFILLIKRIIYIKFGEWSGLYQKESRF